MEFGTIREQIMNLSPEEQARLMSELGPGLCGSVMQNPQLMEMMMERCSRMMMTNPAMREAARRMMDQMMGRMTEEGKQNG